MTTKIIYTLSNSTVMLNTHLEVTGHFYYWDFNFLGPNSTVNCGGKVHFFFLNFPAGGNVL
jgi:hypothetical protein